MNPQLAEIIQATDNLKTLFAVADRINTVGADMISMESVEGLVPGSLPSYAPVETFTTAPSAAGIDDARCAVSHAQKALIRKIGKLYIALNKVL